MADPDLTWQTEVYQVLGGASIGAPVEVHPPVNIAMPYVRIGETVINDHVLGHEISMDVHTFSKTEGSHEAKTIMHAIREALHGVNFERNGIVYTCCREQDARCFLDTENEEWHGVQTFRVLASI